MRAELRVKGHGILRGQLMVEVWYAGKFIAAVYGTDGPGVRIVSKPLRKKPTAMPVQQEQCATCPFRPGSKYAFLAPELTNAALTSASRVCHSTGSDNGINRRTGKPPMLCRGARDVQLKFFAQSGFISEATDAAWEAKCKELGLV